MGHVEGLVEISKVFSQDTVQQRFGRQTLGILAESVPSVFVAAPSWKILQLLLSLHNQLMLQSTWRSHPRARVQMPP